MKYRYIVWIGSVDEYFTNYADAKKCYYYWKQKKYDDVVIEKIEERDQEIETKEEFIREVRAILNANEKIYDVGLAQIVDMVHELAESYRY